VNSNGLVSVVIPTYYRNDGLRRAIESALSQTYDPVEVIVVDDSGERYAEPVAREYDVTYIAHEENLGGNPARNTGIKAASGEYIQLLDDDDRLLPEKLERQIPALEADPSVGVV
jgi:glycosyltransferase involved in cell wall biosynthesis